jgi:hypothetical protein
MTLAQSTRERWETKVRKELEDYRVSATSEDPVAGRGVENAINLFVYEFGMPIAVEILRHAIPAIESNLPGEGYEKMLADPSLDQETRVNINSHKVPMVRDLAYAKLMLDGAPDAKRLKEALDAFEDTFAFEKPRNWNVTSQWAVHSAVLVALVAGDHARAASILASKRSFKDTQRYHDALKRLVANIVKHDGHIPAESEEANDFERLFDIVRQPEPNATDAALGDQAVDFLDIRRLEFALIKERYVTGNAAAPDLQRVFASISQ